MIWLLLMNMFLIAETPRGRLIAAMRIEMTPMIMLVRFLDFRRLLLCVPPPPDHFYLFHVLSILC